MGSREKVPAYDTRKNSANGIQWRGYVYEPMPKLERERVMIIEDHDDYLIVSEYAASGWFSKCKPIGEPLRVNKIGLGRPTNARLELLRRTRFVVHHS